MKKRLSLFLACAMLLGALTACGDKTAVDAPAADGGASTGPIKIGYFGPLTGGTAQAGQAALNGAQIAVNQLNAEGGVLGREVEIVTSFASFAASAPEELPS